MSDTSKKANEGLLNALHRAVARDLLDRVLNGELTADEASKLDPETLATLDEKKLRIACKPQTVANAIKFLKDNGIEGVASGDLDDARRREVASKLARLAGGQYDDDILFN